MLDDARVSPAERREAEERIAEEVTLLWQTDEVRHDRLRVSDEIRHALWFFEHSLISAATDLFAGVARAPARRAEPAHASARGSAATWTATRRPARRRSTRRSNAPASSRSARYRAEVRALAVEIAASRSLVDVSDELDASLAARRAASCPAYAEEIGARNELEPYRRKLSFMWWRLGNDGYARADELLDDLRADPAQPRGERRRARCRRTRRRGSSGWSRCSASTSRSSTSACTHASSRPTARARRSAAAEAARRRHGPAALDTLIVSGTSSADDVLARSTLTTEPLSIVPLFETVDDLDRAPAIFDELLGDRALRGAGARARRHRRGDGRLLGLGQGQRLPRGAVGDLPRAGVARRASRRATTSS